MISAMDIGLLLPLDVDCSLISYWKGELCTAAEVEFIILDR